MQECMNAVVVDSLFCFFLVVGVHSESTTENRVKTLGKSAVVFHT